MFSQTLSMLYISITLLQKFPLTGSSVSSNINDTTLDRE